VTPATAAILYVLLTLGALGVYLLMPRTGRSLVKPGVFFGGIALVGILVLLFTEALAPRGVAVYFCIFAGVALFAAVRVVSHPKPVYSAIYFVLVVVAVAAMLVLLRAEFIAVALIIIYAGAILVAYVFVIMLAQQGNAAPYDRCAREPALAVVAAFLLAAAVAGHVGPLTNLAGSPEVIPASFAETAQEGDASLADHPGNTESLGIVLMTKYVVVLELAGLLLLIAMIGAIALSKKQVPVENWQQPRRPLGEAGREVEPF